MGKQDPDPAGAGGRIPPTPTHPHGGEGGPVTGAGGGERYPPSPGRVDRGMSGALSYAKDMGIVVQRKTGNEIAREKRKSLVGSRANLAGKCVVPDAGNDMKYGWFFCRGKIPVAISVKSRGIRFYENPASHGSPDQSGLLFFSVRIWSKSSIASVSVNSSNAFFPIVPVMPCGGVLFRAGGRWVTRYLLIILRCGCSTVTFSIRSTRYWQEKNDPW